MQAPVLTSWPIFWPAGLAVDGKYAYFTGSPRNLPYQQREAALFRVPVAGGSPEQVAVLPSTGAVACGRGAVVVVHAGGVSRYDASSGALAWRVGLTGEPGAVALTDDGYLVTMSAKGRNVLYALDNAGRSTREHDAVAFTRGFSAFRDRRLAMVDGALLVWPPGRGDLASPRAVPPWLELRASEGIFSSEDAVYLVGVDRRARDRVEAALCRIPWESSNVTLFDTKRAFCNVLGTTSQGRIVVHSHKTSGAEERSDELLVLDATTGAVAGPVVQLDPTWLVLEAALGMNGQALLVVQTEGLQLERSPASQLTWVNILPN